MPSAEDKELFAAATRDVRPVGGKGRKVAAPAVALPYVRRPVPEKSLGEMLEEGAQFSLQYTDEYSEGLVIGLDPEVLGRLRAGVLSPEKHLDLHGLNSRQAYGALLAFIRDAYGKNMRCLTVITGRGKNSPDGVGILRPMVQQWLCRDPFKRVVLAFCSAQAKDGGAGAFYVLLRKYKKSRGRIIWERMLSEDEFLDC
ncbi:MAG: Smr/MutS family protein [Desulfovibrio sp.]|jgi:DNA-nicking Smr family endonuclease|nr:Smr/MutS family protein [Desulfovibrio sp.]